MKNITLDELLTYFDEQHPNQHTREEKITWVSEIEERIYDEIIRPRLPRYNEIITITSDDVGNAVLVFLTVYDYNALLGTSGHKFSRSDIGKWVEFTVAAADIGKQFGRLTFNGYEDNTSGDTVLLVPAMFKDVYRYWLEKNSSMKNREVGAANNALTMFQANYDDYFANFNRKHMVQANKRIIFRG